MGRGGARIGAGRPKGGGRYSEKTKPMRIPESLVPAVTRFIEQNAYKLPLYSSAASADMLFPAELNLQELLVKDQNNTFLVQVVGDALKELGIVDKDILVVDRSVELSSGKIVVVAIKGQLTVKRLQKFPNGSLYLMPESADFFPIEVTPDNNVQIWGLVCAIIHQF